jgi:carbon monoxide dehydrogenase subunit G
MEFAGEHRIPGSAPQVWDALSDADETCCGPAYTAAANCSAHRTPEFAAVVATELGAMRVIFKGQVRLTDLDPPRAPPP